MTPGGYRWWYLDAQSDDGRHALTVIAFIGSVFSPYYAWARRAAARRSNADGGGSRQAGVPAEQHIAINVALAGTTGSAWSMTERGQRSLERGREFLRVGPSELEWRGDALVIRLNEIGCPWPGRIRGEIRLHPRALPAYSYALDSHEQHWWSPLAPLARVEVELDAPRQRWSGAGYLDTNHGAAPLEQAFDGWHWLRAELGASRGADPRAAVLYDAVRSDATRLELALTFDAQGRVERFTPPPPQSLGRSAWRIERATRCDEQGVARVTRKLLDAPFYARSVVETELLGQRATGIHETLSLRRFSSRWIQAMLVARMPRRAG